MLRVAGVRIGVVGLAMVLWVIGGLIGVGLSGSLIVRVDSAVVIIVGGLVIIGLLLLVAEAVFVVGLGRLGLWGSRISSLVG